MLPPAVLWVDPGKMTGLARLRTALPKALTLDEWETVPGGPCVEADEFEFFMACHMVKRMCEEYQDALMIGWERFDINADTHKKTQGGIKDALHVIGACRYLALASGCRILPEAHQHTPDLDDQRKLKKLGWWVPGKNDAQSAAAHMLRWLVRENELTPEMRQAVYG